MLTIVAEYGFPLHDEKEASLFPGGLKDIEMYGTRFAADVQHLFFMCVAFSITSYIFALMHSTIHMVYTAPLTAVEFLRYLQTNDGAPIEPLLWFFSGLGWHAAATAYYFKLGNSYLGFPLMTFMSIM